MNPTLFYNANYVKSATTLKMYLLIWSFRFTEFYEVIGCQISALGADA